MKTLPLWTALVVLWCASAGSSFPASAVLLGWNNLGMHCMDSSYAEFSILPPYNTLEAQLIVNGKLVKDGVGYTLTYEAVADPDGSINTTSIGKGNWIDFAPRIYGIPANWTADQGLAGWNMPGPLNIPQPMRFETSNQPAPGVSTLVNWFRAEGIPITPYDDSGKKNPYPLMRLVARNLAGQVIARSDVVTPVSDEMDCRACHGAGTQEAAKPFGGWITDPNPDREYRLNILRRHDDTEFDPAGGHPALYAEALAAKGLNPQGLYASALAGQPPLCASCHASEALGTPSFTSSQGLGTVPPLTAAIHTRHAHVEDPEFHVALDDSLNRAACYRCHPGSTTRCLRGAMGAAVASDGSMSMQCQSCHGGMTQVGASTRIGWLMEPTCQGCHTGTATRNNGQIRYTSVFEASGEERVAVDPTFATSPNTPAAGLSLYRFSTGHGGLQCSACHGSTHAEFPASHRNDNLRNVAIQGHAGVTVECMACHTTMPVTINGGPHGLHPLGQDWINDHHDAVSQVGLAACQTCHGAESRGTVLSRVQGDRTYRVGDAGDLSFFRGATIGCYNCHQGPSSSSMNFAAPPAIANVSGQTVEETPVDLVLPVGNSLAVLRVISPPSNGTVSLQGHVATYHPYPGFTGVDAFTFASYDGSKNSVLATGTVTVNPAAGPVTVPVISTQPVGQAAIAGASVTLSVTAAGGSLSYQWFRNGWPVTGATDSTLTIGVVGAADVGAYVVLVSNGTTSVASQPAVLTVLPRPPAPVISGFSPASGPVGTIVSVSGSSFGGATGVGFNGVAAVFSVVSPTQISATVPAGATTGKVTVTTPGGTASSASSFTVTIPAPVISGFSPSSGGVGTAVTLSGSNLTGASAVKLNNVAVPFTVISAGSIVAGIPAGAATGKFSVTTPGGTAVSAKSFSVGAKRAAPGVSSWTPTSGPVGTLVTVSGSNLGAATSVRIGTTAASFQVLSATSLRLTVPAGAVTARISVTTPGGTATSNKAFTVSP